MIVPDHNIVTVVGSPDELPVDHRVWGTGSWLPPESREALDWICLLRLHGWRVRFQYPGNRGVPSPMTILAVPSGEIREALVDDLRGILETNRVTLLLRGGLRDAPASALGDACPLEGDHEGRLIRWTGPGRAEEWRCRAASHASSIELSNESQVWAELEGRPVVSAKRFGQGIVVTLGFHPSRARDESGCWTALLRHLLVFGSSVPVACPEWRNTLVLRMDDPGGSQNVFSRDWSYPKLDKAAWTRVGDDLRARDAKLSIGYVSGWVDDGDAGRGDLFVNGNRVERRPGAVYPSPEVCYVDESGHRPGTRHDYASEYAGIQELRREGLAEVELHGYTHLHPDTARWASAPDRYINSNWYRELGEPATASLSGLSVADHPVAKGIEALRERFGRTPRTLICPGDEWTNETLERALDLGIELVSSYYLALRYENRLAWTQHVCAPYLDQPDPMWFDSELPVVGYFHDMELATEGVSWLSNWLDAWQKAGARHLVDLDHLAAVIGRTYDLSRTSDGLVLDVKADSTASSRPIRLRLYDPDGALPEFVTVRASDRSHRALVEPAGDGSGVLQIT